MGQSKGKVFSMDSDPIFSVLLTLIFFLAVYNLFRWHCITFWGGTALVMVLLGRVVIYQDALALGLDWLVDIARDHALRGAAYCVTIALLVMDNLGYKFQVVTRLPRDKQGKEVLK